jgi:hypothetical protein
MQNTTVAALVYEFLFEVYRKMDDDHRCGFSQTFPDENGLLREAFDHEAMGNWEWPAGALEDVGVLKLLKSYPTGQWGRHFYPVITLDECVVADFSEYETFDNYCVAMFSFEYLHSHFERDGFVNLGLRSPRFLEAVASKDDIFLIKNDEDVVFDRSRFKEKIMMHWDAIDVRRILPKGGA